MKSIAGRYVVNSGEKMLTWISFSSKGGKRSGITCGGGGSGIIGVSCSTRKELDVTPFDGFPTERLTAIVHKMLVKFLYLC